MGRTRKTPREATNLTIISIHYSEHDLKEGNINIVDFTVALQNRNRDINKRELCKEDVTGQYALLLLKVFHPDEPRYLELISQVCSLIACTFRGRWLTRISQAESPVYHNYWAKSLDKNQPVQQNRKFDSTGFRIATRKLFVANEQRYPQCIVMEQKDLGLIIVPGIALRAMHQLSFKKVVRSTLEANAEIPLLHLYMRPLCVAIIRRIYHFEDLANQNKKLEEVVLPHRESILGNQLTSDDLCRWMPGTRTSLTYWRATAYLIGTYNHTPPLTRRRTSSNKLSHRA